MFFRKKKPEEVKPTPVEAAAPIPKELEIIDLEEESAQVPINNKPSETEIEDEIFEEQEKIGDDYDNPKLDEAQERINKQETNDETYQEPLSREELDIQEQELELQRKKEDIKLRRVEEQKRKELEAAKIRYGENKVNIAPELQEVLLNFDARLKEIEAVLFRLLRINK